MDFVGLVAVLGAFGIGPGIVYLRNKHKLEEKRLELEAKTGNNEDTQKLLEENKLLRERVENLADLINMDQGFIGNGFENGALVR